MSHLRLKGMSLLKDVLKALSIVHMPRSVVTCHPISGLRYHNDGKVLLTSI